MAMSITRTIQSSQQIRLLICEKTFIPRAPDYIARRNRLEPIEVIDSVILSELK